MLTTMSRQLRPQALGASTKQTPTRPMAMAPVATTSSAAGFGSFAAAGSARGANTNALHIAKAMVSGPRDKEDKAATSPTTVFGGQGAGQSSSKTRMHTYYAVYYPRGGVCEVVDDDRYAYKAAVMGASDMKVRGFPTRDEAEAWLERLSGNGYTGMRP